MTYAPLFVLREGLTSLEAHVAFSRARNNASASSTTSLANGRKLRRRLRTSAFAVMNVSASVCLGAPGAAAGMWVMQWNQRAGMKTMSPADS